MKLEATIPVGSGPHGLRPSPDGKWVYVANVAGTTLSVIDTTTNSKVADVDVGVGPIQVFVSPDNRYLLVANQGTEGRPSTTVSILDTTTFEVLRTVQTGAGAHGIVIEPSSRHAYVTNMYGDDVAVLDLKAQKVVACIPVGATPNGISFSPVTVGARPATKLELPMNHDDGSDMESMP